MLFFTGQDTADGRETLFTLFPNLTEPGKFTVGFTATVCWMEADGCRFSLVIPFLPSYPLPGLAPQTALYAPSSRTLRVLSVPPRASNFSVVVAACRTI